MVHDLGGLGTALEGRAVAALPFARLLEPRGGFAGQVELAGVDRRDPGRQQLRAGGVVRDLARLPLLRLHDVAGPHQGHSALPAALVAGALHQVVEFRDPLAGLRVVASLQVAVLPPVQRMDHVADALARIPERYRGLVGRVVRLRHAVPHAALDEDVRRHVPGVGNGGRDVGEAIGRRQRQRRVHRIVEGVDDVVGRARVIRIALEDAERDRSGQDVQPEGVVAERAHRLQQGQGVERGHLVVVRMLPVEPLHRFHVGDPALLELALAEQFLDRVQEAQFTLVASLGRPLLARLAEPRQGFPRRVQIPLGQQRVVVGERLTPVGEGEVGLDLLRGLKLFARLLVAEAVENRDAADEVLLRLLAR